MGSSDTQGWVKAPRQGADCHSVEPANTPDPYDSCERGRCNHDLARAVGIDELWGVDGPFPAGAIILRPGGSAVLLDDQDEAYQPDFAAEQQRWAV
ncbi:MAG: hypothetical protein WD184_00440 [Acidimicrobiia bacterium]